MNAAFTIPRDTVMSAIAADCHHDGVSEWGVLDRILYTRIKAAPTPRKWTRVSRVSYTPKRMLLIASLISRAAATEAFLREFI